MNGNKKVFIIAGLVIGLALVGGGTAFLLRSLNTNKPTASVPSGSEVESPEIIHEKANNIDHEANEKAKTIEKEADSLMATDPVKAKEKFVEAEQAYKSAGNNLKEAEMRDNAATAETSVPPELPDLGPGLESGGQAS